jgi:hypothetical protein
MSYRTGFQTWSSQHQGFADWRRSGCQLEADQLVLAPQKAIHHQDHPSPSEGPPVAKGASYRVGEAESPLVSSAFAASALIPSWNADTPPGTWIELLMQLINADRGSPWYSLGVWTSSGSATNPSGTGAPGMTRPHSVKGQADAWASVDTDTLLCKEPCHAFRLRVRLFAIDDRIVPRIRRISVTWSDPKPAIERVVATGQGGQPEHWNQVLAGVPQCSQMMFGDAGKAWCSPTALAMVLAYWRGETRPCAELVPPTAAGVYDHVYRGHGNWAFNVAWAASLGLEAMIVRFTSLAELEPWISAGVPLVLSLSWNNPEGRRLANAPVDKSSGHLTLLVGFDQAGNPVMNEPAAPNHESVRRTYARLELENRWLTASGGTVYLIYPRGHEVPELSALRRI